MWREKIKGKRALRAFGSEDGISLLFSDGEWMDLYVEHDGLCGNDCKCWINHVEGSDALNDAVVFSVEGGPINKGDDGTQAVDTWIEKFKTSLGYCDVEMRCEHNGYYGGQLEEGGDRQRKLLVDF